MCVGCVEYSYDGFGVYVFDLIGVGVEFFGVLL